MYIFIERERERINRGRETERGCEKPKFTPALIMCMSYTVCRCQSVHVCTCVCVCVCENGNQHALKTSRSRTEVHDLGSKLWSRGLAKTTGNQCRAGGGGGGGGTGGVSCLVVPDASEMASRASDSLLLSLKPPTNTRRFVSNPCRS